MSVFGSIVSAIFGSKHAATVAPAARRDCGSRRHLRPPQHLGTTPSKRALLPVHDRPLRSQELTSKQSSRNFTTNNAKTSIGGNRSSI